MSLSFVCGSDYTCAPDVHRISIAGVCRRSRKHQRERYIACRENRGVFLCEKMSKEWVKRMEDSHAKVNTVTVIVRVVVVVEDVLKFVKW